MPNSKSRILLIFIVYFTVSFHSASGQSKFHTNPDSAVIHTEDISLFWKVFDESAPEFNKDSLQKKYLDAGSDGVKGFIKMRIQSGENLSRTIKQDLFYYQQVRQSTLSINNKKDTLYKYFAGLKKIYPRAVFPDIYFVIGAKNTGGTTFNGGLIIGAEMFGKETDSFKPRLNIDGVNLVVIHELIHFQQNYAENKSLLAQSIREGAADFICELITGTHPNKYLHEYGDSHEKELWLEFEKKMDSQNWSPWLYYSNDKTRPRDLGYWMGYKIVKAYYEKKTDKEKAISEILNIKDFKEFLLTSEYRGQ